MAAAVLLSFSGEAKGLRPPLADLSLTPDLLAVLRKYQLRQFHPRVVLATVWDWVTSGGGRSERVLGRIRMVGTGSDPHVLLRAGAQPEVPSLLRAGARRRAVPDRGGAGVRLRSE